MTDSLPFASRYGGTFATEAERDAWDAYRTSRIEASLKSPVFSMHDHDHLFHAPPHMIGDAESRAFINTLITEERMTAVLDKLDQKWEQLSEEQKIASNARDVFIDEVERILEHDPDPLFSKDDRIATVEVVADTLEQLDDDHPIMQKVIDIYQDIIKLESDDPHEQHPIIKKVVVTFREISQLYLDKYHVH